MLHIVEPYRRMFAELKLNSFDSVAAFFGGHAVAGRTTVMVKPAMLEISGHQSVEVFYKQYEYRSPSLKFLGRPSKALCEFRNYDAFTQLGLVCAEKIACGEQRDWMGRLRRAFIITRTIPGVTGLIEFVSGQCPDRSSPAVRMIRDGLRQQLAAMTQRIHRAGFFHNDLYWRNILVTRNPSGDAKIWWIDCPRGHYCHRSLWRRQRQLKDLAALDKSASKFCTRRERAAFIKEYLGKTKLDAEVRKLIRDTLAYRRKKWPEEWNEP